MLSHALQLKFTNFLDIYLLPLIISLLIFDAGFKDNKASLGVVARDHKGNVVVVGAWESYSPEVLETIAISLAVDIADTIAFGNITIEADCKNNIDYLIICNQEISLQSRQYLDEISLLISKIFSIIFRKISSVAHALVKVVLYYQF